MSTTTQILFNSPALSSLKRDQLVKLCKIHSIKASGKNVDLVEKLKQHAQTLSKDDPLSLAAGYGEPEVPDDTEEESEEVQNARFQMPRPSEQWEIVMDTIEESEEGSGSRSSTLKSVQSKFGQGTTSEFGTGSSKATSVSSSIKALATSLGLKRNHSKSNLPTESVGSHRRPFDKKQSTKDDEYLAGNSIPYALLAESDSLPQTDHFTFVPSDATAMDHDMNFDRPIPGHPSYPGLPAPSNARLSLGQSAQTPSKRGPSTTIRLVSASYAAPRPNEPETPQLKPFVTSFDLVAGTPFGRLGAWPASPTTERTAKIYPSLSAFDGKLNTGLQEKDNKEEEAEEDDVDMPGAFSSPKFIVPTPNKLEPAVQAQASLAPPSPSPFVFGSPLPQNNLSNTGFSNAAASVLEEMNKRLAQAGVEGLGIEILERKRVSDAGLALTDAQRARAVRGTGIKDKFERMHEGAFGKMDGIDTHYAAKRVSPEKDSLPAQRLAGNKRKSDALGPQRTRTAMLAPKRRSSGMKVVAKKKMVPGGFGDEDDAEDDDDEGNRRESKRPKFEKGRRISIAPPPNDEGEERTQEERDQEAARLLKEREAIKRKLELNKARRRSSMGRPSMGRTSMGRGPVVTQKAKAPSRFGFLSSAKSLVQSVWGKGASSKTSAIPVSKPPVPTPVVKKPTIPTSRPSTVSSKPGPSTSRVPSGGSVASTSSRTSMLKPPSVATTARTRSPIPSFGTPLARGNSRTGSSIGTGARASGSIGMGMGGSSRFGTRNSSSGPSSMGTKAGSSRISSLGTKGSLVGSMDTKRTGNTVDNGSIASTRATPSRLLAPTASSMAKTQPAGARASLSTERGLNIVAEDRSAKVEGPKSTLGQITNSPIPPSRIQSPRVGKIFSQPLSPTPQKPNPSLGSAAVSLTQKPPIPPKPKVLPGRRPRISRSKVIARLASQREASATTTITSGGKTRSSMGAQRRSFGGAKMGRGSAAGESVVIAAKKRARQSEYARRKSRAGDGPSGSGSRAMEVDG